MPDAGRREIRRSRHEVIHERAGEEVPVLVVDVALEEGRCRPVRQATAHLPLGEERVQQPPRVVHGDVVENRDLARLGIDLDDRDVGDEAVGRGRRDLILGIRREQVRCGVVRASPRARAPFRVGATRGSSGRCRRPGGATRSRRRDGRVWPRSSPRAACRYRDRTDADAGEAGGVVARMRSSTACGGVDLRDDVDVGRVDAERVGDDLRDDRAMALPLRRRRRPHSDSAERGDR